MSTNDVAIRIIKKKKNEIGCVYADMQIKGRGTRGKYWISKKGNLFASIFFPLKNNYPPFNEFSIISPVLISSVIRKMCKKNISIKWPNDLLLNKKKICGILQELITFNEKNFLVIGFGINVISHPKIDNKYKATNIFIESKIKPSIKDIVIQIISAYEIFFLNLRSYNFLKFKKKARLIKLN
jgi:BirA family transcriptional regulator, biotin operon repressor / biotin---[acetyl-CoA-carboxylase] ligase